MAIKKPQEANSAVFFKTDSIIRELEKYAHHPAGSHQLRMIGNKLGDPVYYLVAGSDCQAKPFGFPLEIQIHGNKAWIVDVRAVTSPSLIGGFKVTNVPDYELILDLGLATSIWASSDKHFLESIASACAPVYATWISSTLVPAFGLEADQKSEVFILAAYYYWCQLGEVTNPDKVAQRIAIDLRVEFDRVISLIDLNPNINSLADFCTAIKGTSGGVRLNDITPETIYQTSAGVWTGARGRSFMEIALEYPAYFATLVKETLVTRSYSRTRFSDYVKIYDRRPDIKEIPRSFEFLEQTGS